MIKNAVPVDEYVENLIKTEQTAGHISVMCAINGEKVFMNNETFNFQLLMWIGEMLQLILTNS